MKYIYILLKLKIINFILNKFISLKNNKQLIPFNLVKIKRKY